MPIVRVLDTSAVLALISGEPGSDRVRQLLPGAGMSAVNLGEAVGKLVEKGMSYGVAVQVFRVLGISIHPHGDSEALAEASLLTPAAKRRGLGIADRACLAAAQVLGVPAVTADRTWSGVYGDTIQIDVIR